MEAAAGRKDRRGGCVALARSGALAGALLLALAMLLGPGAGPAAAGGCPHAGAEPGDATLKELRRALVCVINQKRVANGRERLDPNGQLNDAAVSHNRVMLRDECFEHRCPGERGFDARVRATGYPAGAEEWKAAENLGYAPTPRKMVQAWLTRRFSRRNLLRARFRDIGVAAGRGVPVEGKPDAGKATYTAVFAWRRG